jgi:hypothetical protein
MVLTLSTVVAEFTPKARVLPARDLTKICMVRKRKKKESKKRFADASYYSQKKKIYSQKKDGWLEAEFVSDIRNGLEAEIIFEYGDLCFIHAQLNTALQPLDSSYS